MILTQFNFKVISVLLVILLGIPNLVFAIPSFPGAVGRGAITQGGPCGNHSRPLCRTCISRYKTYG